MYQVKSFLTEQDKILAQYHYRLTFKEKPFTQWRLLPILTLTDPTLKAIHSNQPLQKWHAEKLVVFYSPFHPFHLSMTSQGNQYFCTTLSLPQCNQIYGNPVRFLIPLTHFRQIEFFTSSLFLTIPMPSAHPFSVQFNMVKGKISWKPHTETPPRFSAIILKIDEFSFPWNKKKQSINQLRLKIAWIPQTKNSITSHKLLLHEGAGKWHGLFFNISGKFFLSDPAHNRRIGQLTVYLDGIQPILQHRISRLSCCELLRSKLEQAQLPNHVTIPLSIDQDMVYLGSTPVPLRTLYPYFKNYLLSSHDPHEK